MHTHTCKPVSLLPLVSCFCPLALPFGGRLFLPSPSMKACRRLRCMCVSVCVGMCAANVSGGAAYFASLRVSSLWVAVHTHYVVFCNLSLYPFLLLSVLFLFPLAVVALICPFNSGPGAQFVLAVMSPKMDCCCKTQAKIIKYIYMGDERGKKRNL